MYMVETHTHVGRLQSSSCYIPPKHTSDIRMEPAIGRCIACAYASTHLWLTLRAKLWLMLIAFAIFTVWCSFASAELCRR